MNYIRNWFKGLKYSPAINTLIKIVPDDVYLRIKHRVYFGEKLDLENPKTFNQKINWLKLYDRKPEYTRMVDKFLVKEYVASKIGEQYIVPTLEVWDNYDDIDWDSLPSQFVIKNTKGGGSTGVVICKDKNKFNINQAIKDLKKAEKIDIYGFSREWPYKDVKRRLIAEKYLVDESGEQLKDYKIFCFNGEPKFVEVDYDRFTDHKLNVYDLEWNFIDFYMSSRNDKNRIIKKPVQLKKMIEFAKILSENIPFIRVDFYSIGDKIYFSELTLYPGAGEIDFHPVEYDRILGDMLELPKNKINL